MEIYEKEAAAWMGALIGVLLLFVVVMWVLK
jgi:flagellar biogenesis protein FliO